MGHYFLDVQYLRYFVLASVNLRSDLSELGVGLQEDILHVGSRLGSIYFILNLLQMRISLFFFCLTLFTSFSLYAFLYLFINLS